MDATDAIRAVLLGEADPSTLSDYGFTISITASGSSIFELGDAPVVRASVPEVAAGYVAAWAAGGDSLRRWAHAMLGLLAIDLIDQRTETAVVCWTLYEASVGRGDELDLAIRLAQER